MHPRLRLPRALWLALLLGTSLACKGSTPEPDDEGLGSGTVAHGGTDPSADGTEGHGGTGGSADGGSSESGLYEAETESDWGECFDPGDYANCAAACAAEGRFCRAQGCGDGLTVKGYATPNCLASFGEAAIGCLDEIMLESTAFECCCV